MGRARIVEVGALSSSAELIDEMKPDTLDGGCRAFEYRRPTSAYRLSVHIASRGEVKGERTAELVARIESEDSLQRVSSDTDAEVGVRQLRGTELQNAASTASMDSVDESFWVVVARDGSRLGSPRAIVHPDSTDVVLANLLRRARYRRMLKLALEQPLCLDVDLRLLTASTTGDWPAAPPGAGSEVLYRTGERIAFEISNKSDESLFTYLFHLGGQGEVQMLDPVRGGHEAMGPGRVRVIGRGRRVFRATTSAPSPGMASPAEHLILFASTREMDLNILLQPGYRGGLSNAGEHQSPLDRSIEAAWFGLSEKLARGLEVGTTDTWSAVVRGFRVEDER